MIRYRYANQLNPPAPFVKVKVSCASTGKYEEDVPAEIDSGADRTVLPIKIISSMNLLKGGLEKFQGFGSLVMELPVYLVTITINDLQPITVSAVAGEAEPFILLVRDVLNSFRILLDGPQLALEIS